MLLGVLFEKVSRERVKITRKVESLGAINLSPILEVAVKNADYSLVSPTEYEMKCSLREMYVR